MRSVKVIVGASIAAISVMVAVAAVGQIDTSARSDGPKVEAVVDAAGNMRVPDGYRTTYQSLGTWAVAVDLMRAGPGQGSKELHVVYASPGTIAAYRKVPARASDWIYVGGYPPLKR
jgi:hypothetical protein